MANANRFLTRTELAAEFSAEIRKQGNIRKQRAFIYDLQTIVGGFPANKKERAEYIRTGRVNTKPRS